MCEYPPLQINLNLIHSLLCKPRTLSNLVFLTSYNFAASLTFRHLQMGTKTFDEDLYLAYCLAEKR